jgi:hypothetical protein
MQLFLSLSLRLLFAACSIANCVATELDHFLFFPKQVDSAVAVVGRNVSYLHLSPFSIDAQGRKFIWLTPGPTLDFVRQDSFVGIWNETTREFSPLPVGGFNIYTPTECENPILRLPSGSVASFFGTSPDAKPREIVALRNTVDCFTTSATGKYASNWIIRMYPPQELIFENNFSVDAIKMEVLRSPIFGAGGTGVWQTFWFARQIGFKYVAGPMHGTFGDPAAMGVSGRLSAVNPSSISLLPFARAVNEAGTEFRVLPPIQAEATVIEYRNVEDFPGSPGGQFFYSASLPEQTFVDRGGAGRFERTGRSFKVGGFSPVCRFYGSVTPGPNSHFYTAQSAECVNLTTLQSKPTPTDRQQWNIESVGFYAVLPYVVSNEKRCPLGTKPVFRAYNSAFTPAGVKNLWNSNHRLSSEKADISELVSKWNWVDEGIAFCTPT